MLFQAVSRISPRPTPLVIILLDLSCVPPTYTQLPPPLCNPHATITQTKKRNTVNADGETPCWATSLSDCVTQGSASSCWAGRVLLPQRVEVPEPSGGGTGYGGLRLRDVIEPKEVQAHRGGHGLHAHQVLCDEGGEDTPGLEGTGLGWAKRDLAARVAALCELMNHGLDHLGPAIRQGEGGAGLDVRVQALQPELAIPLRGGPPLRGTFVFRRGVNRIHGAVRALFQLPSNH